MFYPLCVGSAVARLESGGTDANEASDTKRRRRRVARCRRYRGVGNGKRVSPPQPNPLPSRLGGSLSGVRGGAPAEKEFGALWSCQKATGGNHFEYSTVHVLH